MKLQEQEFEPETVSMLDEIRRADPGEQRTAAERLPTQLIAGACLSRLGLSMAPFARHLKFAPTLGELFCRYEGEDLVEQIGIEFKHWKALGLDPKVTQRMARAHYGELRMRMNHRVPQDAKGKMEMASGGGGVRHEDAKARRFRAIDILHPAIGVRQSEMVPLGAAAGRWQS